MRRILLVIVPAVILLALVLLNQADWRYIVPTQAGELLYAATFDDFGDEWEQALGRQTVQVTDGKLRLELGEVNRYLYPPSRHVYSDFDLRVEASPVAGPINNGYGVIFRYQNPENFYSFLVSSDGYYRVERWFEGTQRVVSDWALSEAIETGLGVTNEVRVVGRGDSFTFYVNDAQVELCLPENAEGQSTFDVDGSCIGQTAVSWTDSALSTGRVGVIAVVLEAADPPGSGVVFDFDNVLVFGPSGDA